MLGPWGRPLRRLERRPHVLGQRLQLGQLGHWPGSSSLWWVEIAETQEKWKFPSKYACYVGRDITVTVSMKEAGFRGAGAFAAAGTSGRSEAREVVLDLGVWDGEDTEAYVRNGFNVVGLEANPDVYRRAVARNSLAVANGRAKLLNLAVGDDRGIALPFYINKQHDACSSFDGRGCGEGCTRARSAADVVANCRVLMVNSTSCERLVREHVQPQHSAMHLVKMDIHGQEPNCLRGFDQLEWPMRPAYFQIEVHKYLPHLHVPLLLQLGYSSFKIVGTNCVNKSFARGASVQAGSLAEPVFDVQRRTRAWRSARDIMQNGKCAGPHGYMWPGTCDLFAKKDAAQPGNELAGALGELAGALGTISRVWDRLVDAQNTAERSNDAEFHDKASATTSRAITKTTLASVLPMRGPYWYPPKTR